MKGTDGADPRTLAEHLDAARTGEEFGAVVMGLFSALEGKIDEDRAIYWGMYD